MDYTRNIDYLYRENAWRVRSALSYSQSIDTSNEAAVATEPVLLADAKLYMKVESSDTVDDDLITAMITAARRMVESYTGMNMVAREVVAIINNKNGGVYLPYGPIGTITSIKDYDDTELTTDQYKVIGSQFKQIDWPCYEYLKVTYTGGYTTCPAELVNAIKAQVLFLYENRGDATVDLSPAVALILNPLRRVS